MAKAELSTYDILCAEYGLPEPVFEEFGDCIKVTMFRKQANKRINRQVDIRI